MILYVKLLRDDKNKFSFETGFIENPVINKQIVEILKGTIPAFNIRRLG